MARFRNGITSVLAASLVAISVAAACGGPSSQTTDPADLRGSVSAETPETQDGAQAGAAPAEGEEVEVLLCDGKTRTKFPAGTPGSVIANALMDEWIEQNPDRNWETKEREAHTLVPSADNTDLVGQSGGHNYGAITEQDVAQWKRETERIAAAGSRVFHNADELGSTVGVSCDMCHPHGANTHPETYPKFQRQLGRTVLLRDMINWCIEHPVRGKPLDSDDPRMRALESYIYAQRKGKALEYGKH